MRPPKHDLGCCTTEKKKFCVYIHAHTHTHLQASTIIGTIQFETEYLYFENPVLFLRSVIQNIYEWQPRLTTLSQAFVEGG